VIARRRPLLRAAAVTTVVGGAGYYAGKRTATNDARMDQLESDVQSMQQPAPQPAMAAQAPMPAAAPPTPPAMGPQDQVAALERLGQLRDSGVLTPEEFALQKARILSS
jgi:hypothetical protein